MKDKLIIITGPTASGKSDIAINVSKAFSGQIISADSQQIYKDMNIGTNKIDQTYGINHHLIDVIDPNENFTVEDFSSKARLLIHQINDDGHIPILTGGCLLYTSDAADE